MANAQAVEKAATPSIRVDIYDQSYNLRGTDAGLAALNIADEYHLLQKKYDSIASTYQERANSLSGMLDEVIGERRIR